MLSHFFIVKQLNRSALIGFIVIIPTIGFAEDEDNAGCLYNQNQSQKEYQQKFIESRQGDPDDLRSIMIRADKNSDRKISVKEAVTAGVGKMFLSLDRNKDRYITPTEVNEWLKDEVINDLWKSFRIADKSRDLLIEGLELRMAGGLSRFSKDFAKLDSDQDGYLNFLDIMKAVSPDVASKDWFLKRLQKKGSIVAPVGFKQF
ncbi:MAG: hypothetical protein U9N57_01195 [Pseudomonadota bacterium]|nr:hypothetical protein [Pseudomonadota bacterium]